MQESNSVSPELFIDEPKAYANFGYRFEALFIDWIILVIPYSLIMYLMPAGINSLLCIIMYWIYFAKQESGNSQATFGKKAVGLKVITVNGDRLSFGQASGRYFGKIISALILCIGYLMIIWDDRGQALHDKMADALVIRS